MWHLLATAACALLVPAPRALPHPSLARAPRHRASTFCAASSRLEEDNGLVARELEPRLEAMQATGAEALSGFHEASSGCFALTPGRPRFSVTSTVFALLAVDASPYSWRRSPIKVVESLDALLEAEWRSNDPFQAVLVVVAARTIDPSARLLADRPMRQSRFAASVASMLSARPKRRAGRKQELSAYVNFWMAQAVTLLLDGSETRIAGGVGGATGAVARRCGAEVTLSRAIPADALPSGAAASVTLALQRAAEVAYDDVCRQLAYHVSNDRVSFDVVVLAYSLLTYVHIGNTLGPAAANAAAGVKDAVGSGSSLPPRNERLVAAALATVFSEFRSEGLWEAGQPIFITRSTGADVGNAFVFSPDLLASLIEVMPASAFLPHLPSISAHLAWLEDHVIEEVLPSGALLRGWRSNHLPPEGGPLGWCTAQALRCIARLRSLSRQLIITDVLGALGGRVASPPDPSAWERLLDSDLSAEEGGVEGMPRGHASGADEAAGDAAGAPPTLKATIERRMLAPLTALSSSDPLQRCFDSTDTHVSIRALEAACSYSAILFGPPGTAKTTVVDAIARNLGWGFVTVDTSTFLKDGLSNVAARISDVFELLGSLENVVVLFDEVEEFALDRSIPTLTMESRMLTTAMLTKLADLRNSRRVAFFIATNRLAQLDAAVTRPGRFDMQLFVGTPNLKARLERFRGRLALDPLNEATRRAAVAAFERVLLRRWRNEAQFLTYLETERLAADAAAAAATAVAGRGGGEGGEGVAAMSDLEAGLEASFEALLESQAATMTVRGSVREEFLASQGLSRV